MGNNVASTSQLGPSKGLRTARPVAIAGGLHDSETHRLTALRFLTRFALAEMELSRQIVAINEGACLSHSRLLTGDCMLQVQIDQAGECVMKPRIVWLLPATITAAFLSATASAPADDFYKGKTLTFVVGFSAGGGFDTKTRLIARHFGKHVPGNPTVVVENRTGAGSLIAANYIFNQAPKDGTVIGNWIGPLVLQQVLGNKAAKFDGRKFGWLGAPVSDSGVCALTKASGIQTMDDWFKSNRPIKIGGTAPGSTTNDVPRLVQAALGFPMKLVEGYKGTAKVRLAAESGEVDGGCWAWESIKPTWAQGLQSGEVRIVLQSTKQAHPDLKDVPLASKYAKSDEARALLDVASGTYSQGVRPYSLPPGVPQDRLQLLQKAFMATMRDPELQAEAKKSKIDIDPIDGPTVAKLMAGLYGLTPAFVSKLTTILRPGKTM
jgi:tripartite-type tricarboxylate transporter receptor subunit TctC